MNGSIVWDIAPSSRFKFNYIKEQHVTSIFREGALFTTSFMLISCLASCALKMEATCSSQMLVNFQRAILRNTPRDRTLQAVNALNHNRFQKLNMGLRLKNILTKVTRKCEYLRNGISGRLNSNPILYGKKFQMFRRNFLLSLVGSGHGVKLSLSKSQGARFGQISKGKWKANTMNGSCIDS